MKKLKAKMLRVSVLALSFILLMFVAIVGTTKKTNAQELPLDFIQYEILDHDVFDDLAFPQPEPTVPYYFKQRTFGYYLYNGEPVYFYVLTGAYSSSVPAIIYTSSSDVGSIDDELIDQEYYSLNSQTLSDACDTINRILVESGYIQNLVSRYYVQVNYYTCIAYGYYNDSNFNVYLSDVEDAVDYYGCFGPINTAYYQQEFYHKMIDHFQTMLSTEGALYDAQSYQRGVQYGKQVSQSTIDSKDNVIREKNELIDELREQLNQADTTFASFTNLLSAIFMFPIDFFTRGLDVNIFGINLGDFILGLFMVVIMISLFKFIIGKRW